MKRYGLVLIVLILTIAPLGCRRQMNLFGRRGAPCSGGQTAFSQGAAAAVAECPTGVCDQGCPTTTYSGAMYGAPYGNTVDGGVIDGGIVNGGIVNGGVIDGGGFGGYINDGGIGVGDINGGFPSEGGTIGDLYNGASIPNVGPAVPGDLSPSLSGASTRANIYGRPAFQVVGDRKLNPGETLPSGLDDDVTAPTKSDKTAKKQ